MKKLITFLLACILMLTPLFSFADDQPVVQGQSLAQMEQKITQMEQNISQEETDNYLSMTNEQITNRFIAINKKYDIGEPFSKKDATFILLYGMYGNPEDSNTVSATETDNATAAITSTETDNTGWLGVEKTKYGAQVFLQAKGTVTVAVGGGTNTFRGQASASVLSGSAQKIRLTTYHEAYGLVGTSGVGKVYSGSVTTGYKTSGWNMDMSKSYTSVLCIYTTIYTSADVQTASGTFNLSTDVIKMTW